MSAYGGSDLDFWGSLDHHSLWDTILENRRIVKVHGVGDTSENDFQIAQAGDGAAVGVSPATRLLDAIREVFYSKIDRAAVVKAVEELEVIQFAESRGKQMSATMSMRA